MLHVLLGAALLATVPTYAAPQADLRMTWNDCAGDAPQVRNKAFACDANVGAQTLVCSFVAPADFAQVQGVELYIDLVPGSGTLPDWWSYLDPGACRQASLGVDFAYGGSGPACMNAWTAGPRDSFVMDNAWPLPGQPATGNHHTTIDLGAAFAAHTTTAFTAGTEYFLAHVRIDNARTTGAGACGGCSEPVCLNFTRLMILRPAGSLNDAVLTTQGAGSRVSWQGSGGDCMVVPVRSTSWGAIKSLYR